MGAPGNSESRTPGEARLEVEVRGGAAPAPGHFKDRQTLVLRAVWPGQSPRNQDRAAFDVFARHPRGAWTLWRRVETLPAAPFATPVDGGDGAAAEAEWSFRDWPQFDRLAFADFRFEARVESGGGDARLRVRSATWRHYASRIGFYGFGPAGERFSNAEIRRVAERTGAAAIRCRQREALKRMAGQVAPGENGLKIYGYSLGGRAGVGLARWLERRGIGVELLVGIDPVDLAAQRLVISRNVRRAISYYQRNGARIPLLFGPAGRGLPFAGAGEGTAIENRRIDVAEGGWSVMHEDAPYVVSREVAALLG